MRNICRFIGLPSRHLYRLLGRALRFLCDLAWPGWSFESLERAVPRLTREAKSLSPPLRSCCCSRCGREMSGPGVIVADAGQAYEDIPIPLIWSWLDRLFLRLEKICKCRTVTVFRTRRSHCRLGGHCEGRIWDRVVFYFSSIKRALTGFMSMRFFRLGKICTEQKKGIPIGGPLSGNVLHVVLSEQERHCGMKWPTR